MTGQSDLSILVVNGHRSFTPLSTIVGNLVNLTPVRLHCYAGETVIALAKRLHTQRAAGLRHSLYPHTLLAYRDTAMPTMPRFNFIDRTSRWGRPGSAAGTVHAEVPMESLKPTRELYQAVEREGAHQFEVEATNQGLIFSITLWGDTETEKAAREFGRMYNDSLLTLTSMTGL